jgi:hypothetical protein
MTYKTYKIKKIITNPKYIKFELNSYVEFNDRKEKFIYCVNEYPFTSYRESEEIEINLTEAKLMSARNYHQKIVRKVSKSYTGGWGYYDDYNSLRQDEGKRRQGQLQTQEQVNLFVSAYDKKVAHKLFRNSLE